MTSFLKAHWDKGLFILAALCLAVSVGWAWGQTTVVRRMRAQPVKVQPAGAVYKPKGGRRPDSPEATWSEPTEPAAGSGWFYDLFTPPAIYYDAKTRAFAVTPANNAAGGDTTSFGLELMGVRPELYRLQLIGFVGGPGNLVGAFVEPGRAGVLLAREGHRFESLGLTLKNLSVGKVAAKSGQARPTYEIAALAMLHDEATGEDIMLDSRSRRLTGQNLALVRMMNGVGVGRELREGDTLLDGGSTYRVERIQLDPPELKVVRELPGMMSGETKVLHPAPSKLARFSSPPTGSARVSRNAPPEFVTSAK